MDRKASLRSQVPRTRKIINPEVSDWESETDEEVAQAKQRITKEKRKLKKRRRKRAKKRHNENSTLNRSCSCTSFSEESDCCCCSDASLSCSSDSDERFAKYYRLSSDEDDLRGVEIPQEPKKKRRGMRKLLLHTFTMWDDIWRSNDADEETSAPGPTESSSEEESDNSDESYDRKTKGKNKEGEEEKGNNKKRRFLSDVALSKRLKQTLMLKQEHGVFFSGKWYGLPVEELDPFIYEDTFCVLSYRPKGPCVAYRFYKGDSLGLFPPDHPIRTFAFKVTTHRYFQKFIVMTIFANCISLALERFEYDEYGKRHETELDVYIAIFELLFLSIYTVEMLLKIIAKGFLFQKMSYLRNGWNFLDFVVVISNYVSLVLELMTTNDFDMEFEGTNYEFLRIFRVLRIVKIVSILPGLRKIVTALLKSGRQLTEVFSLSVFSMVMFSVFGMEFFSGKFRQKCVRIKGFSNDDGFAPDHSSLTKGLSAHMTDRMYGMWVEDEHNWLYRDAPESEPIPCGNGSTARKCPEGFVCLEVANSKNPNNGWISFDNFPLAMMATLQTMNQDYWERIYEFALSTVGYEGTIYFAVVIFFGGYYLLNLFLAVVTLSYDKEQSTIDVNRTDLNLPVPKKLSLTRHLSRFNFEHLNQQRLHLFEGFHNKPQRERDELLLRMIKADEFAHPTMTDRQFKITQQFSHAIYKLLRKVGRYKYTSHKESVMEETLNMHRKPIPEDGYYDEFYFFDGQSDSELVNPKDTHCLALKNGKKCNFGLVGFDQTFVVEDMSKFVKNPVREPDFELFPRINRWESLQAWLAIWSHATKPIVEDWKFRNFMIFCIFTNAVISCFEHFGQPRWMDYWIHWSNDAFTYVFCLELVLKIIAYQGRFYEYGWNKFDLYVVIASVLGIILHSLVGYKGFRSFSQLRVLRLAQAWDTMKVLLNILFSAIGDMANLLMMLFFSIYIFAMFGMQYLGSGYEPKSFKADFYPANYPRWAWQTSLQSVLMVFRVVCGAEWIELIWECFDAYEERHEEYKCLVVFVPMLVFGNFIVLNLFLALLLHIFDSAELNTPKSVRADRRNRDDSFGYNMKRIYKKMKGWCCKNKVDGETDEDRRNKLKIKLGLMKSKVAPEKKEEKKNLIFMLKPKVVISSAETTREDNFSEPAIIKPPLQLVIPRRYPKWRFYKVVHKYMKVGDRNNVDDSEDDELLDHPKHGSKLEDEDSETEPKAIKNERFRQAVIRVMLRIRKQKTLRILKRFIEIKQKQKRAEFLARGGPSKTSKFGSALSRAITVKESTDEIPLPCFPKKWQEMPICVCCWLWGTKSIPCLDRARAKAYRLVTNNIFEWTILLFIVASCVIICFDDIYIDEKPTMKEVLFYSTIVTAVVFFLEFLIQVFARGIYDYFTNPWSVLDFAVMVVTIITAIGESLYRIHAETHHKHDSNSGVVAHLGTLKVLRTLRSLRAIRAISKWHGMKIVTSSVLQAFPKIFNVFCVCLVFWLVFAIMGVQFFKGRYYKCVNSFGETVDPSVAPNRQICCQKVDSHGFSWTNTFPNFDSVPQAYLALLYLATFEGWMDVIRSGVDARDVDQQPLRDYDFSAYLFFTSFCLFGGFLTMKLFIGVIIDNFNMLKKQFEGSLYEALISPSQIIYYEAIKKLGAKRPRIILPKPRNPVRLALFELANSQRTELVMFIIILLNMLVMCCDGYGNAKLTDAILESLNAFFIYIYTMEAIVKLVGLGTYYFKSAWNIFDLVILIISAVDYAIGDLLSHNFPIPPSIVRLCRILRVGRVMRLMKSAKGIRRLVFALFVSIPALFNVVALLLLVIFIYAILGMTFFGNIGYGGGYDELINFETFPRAFFLLFRLITVGSWNDVLGTLMAKDTPCGPQYTDTCGGPGQRDCANETIAILFVVTYLILTNFVIVNMFIAIILENFNQANVEDDYKVTGDDVEIFLDKWAIFDGDATQFMELQYLAAFLDVLEPPLRRKFPNQIAITALDIPIYQGELVQLFDVMRNLVVFVMSQSDTSKMEEIQKLINTRFVHQFRQKRILPMISTTRIWKIQHNAARVIQKAWRKYCLAYKKYEPPVKVVFAGTAQHA